MAKVGYNTRIGGVLPATPRKLGLRGGRGSSIMYYTYILKSKKDGKLYVGYTNDLKRRFKRHNDGKVEATKNRLPFILVYYEACINEDKAIKREKYFKTGFGRRFLKSRI
jgi:putative endonuclease